MAKELILSAAEPFDAPTKTRFDPRTKRHVLQPSLHPTTRLEAKANVAFQVTRDRKRPKNLARESWLRFGGFDGWFVWIHGQARFFQITNEETRHDFLATLASTGPVSLNSTRYERDMISFMAEGDLACITYRTGAGKLFESCNHVASTDCDDFVVFSPPSGFDHEVRLRHVVSRKNAIESLESILAGNGPIHLADQS